MGRMAAEGMKVMGLRQEALLQWHLQHNHYPPVSTAFIPMAQAAIECANCGDWEELIDHPVPGREAVPVWQVIEGLHLDTFLDAIED